MRALSPSGRPVDDVIDDLRSRRSGDVRWEDGRTFGMVYDGGPGVREVAERAASLYLHENALNTAAFPSLGAIQSDVVGLDRRAAPRPRHRRRVPDLRGYRVDPVRGQGGPGAGPGRTGHRRPEVVVAESAHAAFHKAAHLFGITLRKVAGRRRLAGRPRRHGRPGERAHRAGRRLRTPVPAGCHRRHPGHRRAGRRAGRELPRRCVHGWVRAALRRAARSGGGALGLPRRGRDLHQRGHPQAGLRPQGRVGDPAPHQGAAPPPDLRVRRLARGLLRLAQPPGHPVRAAHGDGVGGDAPPRASRATSADRAGPRHRRPDAGGIEAIDGVTRAGRRRVPPGRHGRRARLGGPVDVFALGDALQRRGWFHDRQTPARHAPRHRLQHQHRCHRRVPGRPGGSASTRCWARGPRTARPATPPSSRRRPSAAGGRSPRPWS